MKNCSYKLGIISNIPLTGYADILITYPLISWHPDILLKGEN
jgi:hypothetical protein